MAGARGNIERRGKFAGLPYVVECPRPSGVWRELDAMHAWVRARCGNDGYMTTSREDRTGPGLPRQILRMHFADEATARAFAAGFGLPYPAKGRDR